MDKQEVIAKLKEKNITEQDKIDIFNWYIKNECPEVIATFEQIPNKEFRLTEQQISTANSTQAKQMLMYSIIKIREDLGITKKTELNLMMFLMGFR